MAGGRSTEKPLSRRKSKDERRVKRKQAQKDDVSKSDERMEDRKSKKKRDDEMVDHESKSKKKRDDEMVDHESKKKRDDEMVDHESKKKRDDEMVDHESKSKKKRDDEMVDHESKKKRDDEMVDHESKGSDEDDTCLKAAMVVLPSSSTSNNPKYSLEIQDHVKERRLFEKWFSYEDEEKILQVMIREGEHRGSKGFWKLHMKSMDLSITVNEVQLYWKGRRLKKSYINHTNNYAFPGGNEERKVFELCAKLWGKEIDDINLQKEKKNIEKALIEYKKNHAKFVMEFAKGGAAAYFPFNEAMKIVPISKREGLENKYEELYKKKISLVNEILEAIGPLSSQDH